MTRFYLIELGRVVVPVAGVSFALGAVICSQGLGIMWLVLIENIKRPQNTPTTRKDGKPYSVRYDQVNATLLNEFLNEHRTVQAQQKEIDALKQDLRNQKALIEKVNARLNNTAP